MYERIVFCWQTEGVIVLSGLVKAARGIACWGWYVCGRNVSLIPGLFNVILQFTFGGKVLVSKGFKFDLI